MWTGSPLVATEAVSPAALGAGTRAARTRAITGLLDVFIPHPLWLRKFHLYFIHLFHVLAKFLLVGVFGALGEAEEGRVFPFFVPQFASQLQRLLIIGNGLAFISLGPVAIPGHQVGQGESPQIVGAFSRPPGFAHRLVGFLPSLLIPVQNPELGPAG